VYCNWTIDFAAGQYDFAYSDVIEMGAYTCDGATIDGGNYTGVLDLGTGILTWDGVEYEQTS